MENHKQARNGIDGPGVSRRTLPAAVIVVEKPTARQHEYLDQILGFFTEYKRPPTRQELADRMGLKSKSGPQGAIEKLAAKGLVRVDAGGTIIPLVYEICPFCER